MGFGIEVIKVAEFPTCCSLVSSFKVMVSITGIYFIYNKSFHLIDKINLESHIFQLNSKVFMKKMQYGHRDKEVSRGVIEKRGVIKDSAKMVD